jgi:H+/Cl- antiporter ClcA
MVAYFAGVVQTPITAFVIVMEMTDNHAMVLPLMATAFIAFGASKLICQEPIYRSLAQGFLDRLRAEEPNPAEPDKVESEKSDSSR